MHNDSKYSNLHTVSVVNIFLNAFREMLLL